MYLVVIGCITLPRVHAVTGPVFGVKAFAGLVFEADTRVSVKSYAYPLRAS